MMGVGADVVLCMQQQGDMMDTWRYDWPTRSFILELGVPFININLKLKSEGGREERKKKGGTERKESFVTIRFFCVIIFRQFFLYKIDKKITPNY